jgi:Apea-like HEPN
LHEQSIDYWIGLEALFFPPEKILQMSESIALTISYYLGQTADERNAIYRQVNGSHALRGKVVHGKPVDGKKLREMTTKTCEFLRHSLRKRIEE